MITSLSKSELKDYMNRQFSYLFPDKYEVKGNDVDAALTLALDRLEYCFKPIKAYKKDGKSYFSHLHSDQYSAFLYFFSNSLWSLSQNQPLCDKAILVNKMLSGMFFSYKCELPDIFVFVHAVGTVLGNASYSDYLVVMQNVTVNTSSLNGAAAPSLGRGLLLSAGSKILGNKPIGDRVSIGANAVIYQQPVPDDSVAILPPGGELVIRPREKKHPYAQGFFDEMI